MLFIKMMVPILVYLYVIEIVVAGRSPANNIVDGIVEPFAEAEAVSQEQLDEAALDVALGVYQIQMQQWVMPVFNVAVASAMWPHPPQVDPVPAEDVSDESGNSFYPHLDIPLDPNVMHPSGGYVEMPSEETLGGSIDFVQPDEEFNLTECQQLITSGGGLVALLASMSTFISSEAGAASTIH